MNSKFIEGNLFSEDIGTSLSAPYISHLAGRISSLSKEFSTTLIKALLVANSNSTQVKIPDSIKKDDATRLRGYGKVDEEFLFRSSEEVVILYSTEHIENDKNHFFELPIPEIFFKGEKRKREITVALSYNSATRNTRISYRATRLSFKLLKAKSMDEVIKTFNKYTKKEDYENIPEYSTNRSITAKLREKGTVQASTWEFKKPENSIFFIVVTRNDFPWGEKFSKEKEEYSLVIVIKDKEAKDQRLYTRTKEALKIREKLKVK